MNPLKLANPVHVVRTAVGVAGTAVGVAGVVARESLHMVAAVVDFLEEARQEARQAPAASVAKPPHAAPDTAPATAPNRATASSPVDPPVPSLPPVDVVEQALAAERHADPDGPGLAHEPHASTREEDHGQQRLQPAEVEEIAAEEAAALEGDQDQQVPEGQDEQLDQPLLDPADAKAMESDFETLRRASDPDKG